MKKKWVALLMAACLSIGTTAGCGGNAQEEGAETQENGQEDVDGDAGADTDTDTDTDAGQKPEDEDLADISVAFWTLYGVPEEKDMVEEAINEITEEKIGVTVHLNIMDVGTYLVNGSMVNGVMNGEDFDLVLTTPGMSGHFANMRNNGMLLSLNDLLEEYGAGILETVPENLFSATTRDGNVYAVPAYSNLQKSIYYAVKREVAESCNLDMDSIKDLDDVEGALAAIKEAFPEKNAISGGAQKLNIFEGGFAITDKKMYDSLGIDGTLATVFFDDEALEVKSWYETEEFKKSVDYAKRWYELGYVDKDLAVNTTQTEPFADDVNASSFVYANDTLIKQYELKDDVVYVKLMDTGIQTSDVQMFTWGLPVSCDEPEAAMKFLNLMYTDAEVLNLLGYGIEGQHYVEKGDGTIGYPDGKDETSNGYAIGTALLSGFGNSFLLKVWEGADADANEQALAAMEQAVYSPLMGFTLDTTEIGDLYSALASIALNEYGPALKCGSGAEGYYEEFIEKLHAAGLQELLDEAQRQVQEWAAAQ